MFHISTQKPDDSAVTAEKEEIAKKCPLQPGMFIRPRKPYEQDERKNHYYLVLEVRARRGDLDEEDEWIVKFLYDNGQIFKIAYDASRPELPLLEWDLVEL